MSRKDIYSDLEVEQIRRNQRGIRPMSAVGGFLEGYQEARLRGLKIQEIEDRMRMAREKEIQTAKEKNRGIEESNLSRQRVWKTNMERYKRGEEVEDGLLYRPKDVDFVPVPEEYKGVETVGSYLVGKAKDFGEKALEMLGGSLRNFGLTEVQEGTGKKEETFSEITQRARPSIDDSKLSGGIDVDRSTDLDRGAVEFNRMQRGIKSPSVSEEEEKNAYDAAGYADGGIIRRGVRFQDGTLGGVETAAMAQGLSSEEEMMAESGAGREAPVSPSGGSGGGQSQKRQPETSPYEILSQKDPQAAQIIKRLGQDPGTILRRLTDQKANALSEILNRAKFDGDEYLKAAKTFEYLEAQGVYAAFNLVETDKDQAIRILSERSGEKVRDIVKVPMSYSSPNGVSLKYNNYKVIGQDGSSAVFDTRNLYMQTLSLGKLLDQEGKWADDIIQTDGNKLAAETKLEIAKQTRQQAADARAARDQQRDRDDDIKIGKLEQSRVQEIMKTATASMARKIQSLKQTGKGSPLDALMSSDASKEERMQMILAIGDEAEATFRNLPEFRNLRDDDTYREFSAKAPQLYQKIFKDVMDKQRQERISELAESYASTPAKRGQNTYGDRDKGRWGEFYSLNKDALIATTGYRSQRADDDGGKKIRAKIEAMIAENKQDSSNQ